MSVIKKGKEDSLANLKYSLDTYNDGSFTPIQFRVYDSNKQLYTGWEICWGSAKKKNFYSPFPQKPLSYWHINNKLSIENDLELITPLNFDEKRLRSEIEAKKYDYIVLSFWAGYLGSLSREMLHDIESAIQREPGKRFLHIKVNLSD